MEAQGNWRSLQEWESCGLKMSTPSDTACRLYDAALTQMYGHHDDPAYGGLEKTMRSMLTADPDFVLGRTMKMVGELNAGLRNPNTNPEFKEELNSLQELAEKQAQLTLREKQHVQAVTHLSTGNLDRAVECWEWILADHPFDAAALTYAYYGYLFLGRSTQMRDVPAGLMKIWKPQTPLYSYLFSLTAFGLEETYMYGSAKEMAEKALELNPNDTWATHVLSHVYESQGYHREGIEKLYSLKNAWDESYLACHQHWHMALLHLQNDETEAALEIFENEVGRRAKSGVSFNMNDAITLLTRLKLKGIDIEKGKWSDILRLYECRLHDHSNVFNDVHMALLCAGVQDETFHYFNKSLKSFSETGKGQNWQVTKEVGLPIVEGIEAWNQGRFEAAVEALYPIRTEIIKIGGSHAQRDVLNQILIASAHQSPKYQTLAKRLVNERMSVTASLKDRLELALAQ